MRSSGGSVAGFRSGASDAGSATSLTSGLGRLKASLGEPVKNKGTASVGSTKYSTGEASSMHSEQKPRGASQEAKRARRRSLIAPDLTELAPADADMDGKQFSLRIEALQLKIQTSMRPYKMKSGFTSELNKQLAKIPAEKLVNLPVQPSTVLREISETLTALDTLHSELFDATVVTLASLEEKTNDKCLMLDESLRVKCKKVVDNLDVLVKKMAKAKRSQYMHGRHEVSKAPTAGFQYIFVLWFLI